MSLFFQCKPYPGVERGQRSHVTFSGTQLGAWTTCLSAALATAQTTRIHMYTSCYCNKFSIIKPTCQSCLCVTHSYVSLYMTVWHWVTKCFRIDWRRLTVIGDFPSGNSTTFEGNWNTTQWNTTPLLIKYKILQQNVRFFLSFSWQGGKENNECKTEGCLMAARGEDCDMSRQGWVGTKKSDIWNNRAR